MYRKDLICQHNNKNKSNRFGRARPRASGCVAKLVLKVKNQSYWAKYRNPVVMTYPSEVTIVNDHCHIVGSEESLSFLRPREDIRADFYEYFRSVSLRNTALRPVLLGKIFDFHKVFLCLPGCG